MMGHRPASGQGARLHVPPSSPRGGHRHGGKSAQADGTSGSAEPSIEESLLEHRQKLSQAIATVRAITTRRNQQIAEALWDGVPPAAVAAATATAPKAVRTIGLSYEDMLPQGAHPDTHLLTVSSTTRELQDAEGDKTRLKRQRDDLIAAAHRLGIYDEYQIGALTGVPAPEIKKMIRGTRTVPSKPVRSQ